MLRWVRRQENRWTLASQLAQLHRDPVVRKVEGEKQPEIEGTPWYTHAYTHTHEYAYAYMCTDIHSQ